MTSVKSLDDKDIATKFLNKSLTSYSKLATSLDSISSDLQEQHTTLNTQLYNDQQALLAQQKSSQDNFLKLINEWDSSLDQLDIQNVEQLENNFNTSLQEVQSHYPNSKISEFDKLSDQFQHLSKLIEYKHLIRIAETISKNSKHISQLNLSSELDWNKAKSILESLQPYDHELRSILTKIKNSSSQKTSIKSVETQLPVKILNYLVENAYAPLCAHLNSKLEELMKEAKWPTAIVPKSLYEKFTSIFTEFLEILPEEPERLEYLLFYFSLDESNSYERQQIKERFKYPVPLLPFTTLIKPIDLRFKFHFEKSDIETNRPDKPEWYYHHCLNLIDVNLTFMFEALDPALKKSSKFNQRKAVNEFITTLLPMVRNKTLSLFDQISESIDTAAPSDLSLLQDDEEIKITETRPSLETLTSLKDKNSYAAAQLLAHLVYETLVFDNSLKEKYYYYPFSYSNSSSHGRSWRGLAGDLLSAHDYRNFKIWVNIEKLMAFQRYHEIVDESSTAFQIDYEYGTNNTNQNGGANQLANFSNQVKPTESAIYLKDLIESVTDHYASLSSVRFRLKYFVTIQIGLLDKYYDRLSQSMDAFESLRKLSSKALKATKNVSAAATSVAATAGTAALLKIVGVNSIPSTGDESEMVKGINGLERLCRIYGSLSFIIKALKQWGEEEFYLQLLEDISSLSGNGDQPDAESSNTGDSTLFDETIQSYTQLIERCQNDMLTLLKEEFKSAMKEYFKNNWSSNDDNDDNGTPEVSRSLLTFFKAFSPYHNLLLSLFGQRQTPPQPNTFRSSHSLEYTLFARKFSSQVVDWYLFNYVISSNRFNQLGGKQFKVDLQELYRVLQLPHDSTYKKFNEMADFLSLPAKASNQAPKKPVDEDDDEVTVAGNTYKSLEDVIKTLHTTHYENEGFEKIRKDLKLNYLTNSHIETLINRRSDK